MHGQNREAYKAKARDGKVSAARAKKALQWNGLSNQILLQHKRNKGRGSSSLHRSHGVGTSYNAGRGYVTPSSPGARGAASSLGTSLDGGVNKANESAAPYLGEGEMGGPAMIVQTRNMLLINPDPLYLWNIRRDVLITGPHSAHGAAFDLDQELKLTASALENNPKAYGAWLHRKWSVRHYLMVVLPSLMALHSPPNNANVEESPIQNQSKATAKFVSSSTLLSSELDLCGKLLSMDERNFHCWNYRRFIVSCRGYVIMKRHAHSCLFLQQATREDCSDFYFVRNYAEHPYSTKFAMDGNWKMLVDYMQYNFSEHTQNLKEVQRQKMLLAQQQQDETLQVGIASQTDSRNADQSVSSSSTTSTKLRNRTSTGIGRHRKQGSGGSLSHLHLGGGSNKGDGYNDRGGNIRNMFSTLMGPQLTPLTYTNIGGSDDNPHATDEEVPVTLTSEDSASSEDLLSPPRLELVDLLQTEWNFTTQKIEDNFSNGSAFHYRSKLLPLYAKYCCEPSSFTDEAPSKDEAEVFNFDDLDVNGDVEIASFTDNTTSAVASVVMRLKEYYDRLIPLARGELHLIQQAIYTEPDDQTPWWYHHFLLDWIQPPTLDSLLSPSSGQNQSRQQQQKLSFRKEDEERVRGCHAVCVAAYRKRILEQEIDGLEELLEAEDGQLKWAWTALHTLYGFILKVTENSDDKGTDLAQEDEAKFREKIKECVERLLELDPDRKGRYLDMMEKESGKEVQNNNSLEEDR